MSLRVAIVGGGWAGCAAGLSLAEAGVKVTLYEAANTLGGRARGLTLNALAIDNGQHLLLGAYQQTLRLIDRVWPDSTEVLLRLPLTIDQPPDFLLRCPKLPAPFHLLAGLLTARGLTGWEKWAAARWMHLILREPNVDDVSVAQLIEAQPRKIREALWEPVCVAALNTPIANASARVFVQVLQSVFNGARQHSDLLFPRCDLTQLFPEPATQRILALGGNVHLQTRIQHIDANGTSFRLSTPLGAFDYDRVIIAVAPQHLAKIGQTIPVLQETITGVATYDYEAIATLYLQYPTDIQLARPMLALADGPAQYVFDRGATHGQPGLLALVVSAASHLSDMPGDWAEKARAQLTKIGPLPQPVWQKSIVEKQASYACRPKLYRPENNTPHPGLFLAGDYTAGPYSATLESATLSGVKSAELVLNSL